MPSSRARTCSRRRAWSSRRSLAVGAACDDGGGGFRPIAVAPAPEEPPEAADVEDVLTGPAAADVAKLQVIALDRRLAPEVRYAALRRLEEAAPATAVDVAMALLGEDERFLRNNAIAVLVRSEDPRADLIVASLRGDDRRLADALARAR